MSQNITTANPIKNFNDIFLQFILSYKFFLILVSPLCPLCPLYPLYHLYPLFPLIPLVLRLALFYLFTIFVQHILSFGGPINSLIFLNFREFFNFFFS